ncbi:NmrA family NAD(P)-binding protein [Ramlibacter tataouinensis]|uniref:Isoflavone reductase (NADPH:isoflavone oxidoreductase)-like protein n=1 Tax=Ramlibacter tataouinensis (strain ATCC BAA-407 / DSM 14655 / LMG 21543 / TTB310) TaxID=365046 RepID=F5Y4D0_RAMTT|nr:NmrA family NAD(P)-binding protein [Ramlibacter tataouinensis]AEG93777.1 isoflavone reductase (NADPH:isoflavone oxidoreductase)-like protein [Ramlibacter tataouinensis TTB310]
MTQTVLIVGATGMLGRRIAHHLVRSPQARVRLLVRDPHGKKEVLDPLAAKGAEVVAGDLSDAASLDRATRGVDVIVSAVQGGPEVIVEGQVRLAEIGKRNAVRRILPSDYALDLFKATPGEHTMFDMRAQADARIAETGLEQVNVLQGGFMELFMPGKGAIDLEAGTVSFFGDGHRPVEVTSVEDTARMVARAALDRALAAGKFAFAGDRVSFRQAGEIVARQSGRPIRPVSLGSEADLRALMAQADPHQQVMLAYLLYMTNGQTALTGLQNDRYGDLKLQGFADFVARQGERS